MKTTILSFITIFAAALAASSYATDFGGKSLVLKAKDGLAIQGYDPVAYFTDNKAVKGSTKFSSEYDGAKYFFASAEHKVLFESNPDKYAPAYGGYCGYAASINRLSPISPEWFQIEDGKLILQQQQEGVRSVQQGAKGECGQGGRELAGPRREERRPRRQDACVH